MLYPETLQERRQGKRLVGENTNTLSSGASGFFQHRWNRSSNAAAKMV